MKRRRTRSKSAESTRTKDKETGATDAADCALMRGDGASESKMPPPAAAMTSSTMHSDQNVTSTTLRAPRADSRVIETASSLLRLSGNRGDGIFTTDPSVNNEALRTARFIEERSLRDTVEQDVNITNQWRKHYGSEAAIMSGLIHNKMRDEPSGYLRAFTELMLLKDSPESFRNTYDRRYRWSHVYRRRWTSDAQGQSATAVLAETDVEPGSYEPVRSSGTECVESKSPIMPNGWKWVLELHLGNPNKKPKWHEWVYVAQSTIRGRYGLFAARLLLEASIVGYAVGDTGYRWTKRTKEPPSRHCVLDVFSALTMNPKASAVPRATITVRDRDGAWRTIVPELYDFQEGSANVPLYMGMHYMNRAEDAYNENTPAFRLTVQSKTKNNVYLREDGAYVTKRRIQPNEELWCEAGTAERFHFPSDDELDAAMKQQKPKASGSHRKQPPLPMKRESQGSKKRPPRSDMSGYL